MFTSVVSLQQPTHTMLLVLASEKLIFHALSDIQITGKLRKVDVVIWNEASMSTV